LFDRTKFCTPLASHEFLKQYLGRNVVLETRVKFEDLVESAPRAVEIFTKQKWVEMLSIAKEVSPTLVREFYANIHDFKDGTFQSMLWGKPILVSPALICELTSTPLVNDSPYPWTPEKAPSHMQVFTTLGIGQTKDDTQYHLKTLPVDVHLIYRIVAACIYLFSRT
jgi:hypothetical protein